MAVVFFAGVSQSTWSTPGVRLPGFHLAPPAHLRCLDDTSLEPTHGLMDTLPLNGMPPHPSVGSCTSRTCCCHLLCLLYLFAKRSRHKRPEGSLPACAERTGPPIRSITERPSLAPSSHTPTSMSSPYGLLALVGDVWAYHFPCPY